MQISYDDSHSSAPAFNVEEALEAGSLPSAEPAATVSTFLEALQEAACVVDEDLRVRDWNSAMIRLTGLSRNQALWQPLFSLFPKNFKQALAESCSEAFAQAHLKNFAAPEAPGAAEGEIQQFHGRDVFLTFRYRLSILETTGHGLLALLSLCEVRHERMLKKHSAFREQLHLLGMLNASVAQELSGALDLICHKLDEILKSAHGTGDQKLALDVEEIIPQIYRIGYLTNNIVSLGRDIAPHLVYLNVNEALQEALGFLEQTQKRKTSCVTALTPSLPVIAADPGLLQIVFQNLMKYALEAAGEDTVPRVHTTAAPEKEGIIIQIEDRGPQLDEETLANFFDPAFTSARWGLATGLGLLLSKKIIEAHHGSIAVCSRDGSGTRLTIFLPEAGQWHS